MTKDRSKIYPTPDELEQLGFKRKGKGEDPRDYWFEIDLSNYEASGNSIDLTLDAYFDFTLNMPELIEGIPLNFRSIEEIRIFIDVFKRPYNHAFAGFVDIVKDLKQ
jgi:hypothetical protein